jgi:glutathione-specific gamma-glutamylcyclotransferase
MGFQGDLLDQFRAQTAGQGFVGIWLRLPAYGDPNSRRKSNTSAASGAGTAPENVEPPEPGQPRMPGLVFALLPGGSCQGVVYRVDKDQADEVLVRLWEREMPMDVYTPSWLPATHPKALCKALAFTLPRSSPSFTGHLPAETYRHIFQQACGRFGTTLDYARQTYNSLQAHGIEDRALAALLRHADKKHSPAQLGLTGPAAHLRQRLPILAP